jgi:hypothetical protein
MSTKHPKPGTRASPEGSVLFSVLALAGLVASIATRQWLVASVIYGVVAVVYYAKGGGRVKEGNKSHAKRR